LAQWDNNEHRSRCHQGCHTLSNFVKKRFAKEGYNEFFGPEPEATAKIEKLTSVCGGHFRDLLRLLREAVLRADSWPASDEVLEQAIVEVRGDFLPIAIDDAIWLSKIAKLRESVLPSVQADDVNRLTRFLDTHFVLYLKNGEEWYDIHPLIREEVESIVQRHTKSTGDKGEGWQ